jgi:hypothetical protein
MNKKNLILWVVLGLQVVLASVFVFQESGLSKKDKGGFVFANNADVTLADEITIVSLDQKDKPLTLKKEGNQWNISELIKASNSKVTEALNKIRDIKPSWAVATTKESHKRFEVSKEKFQRQITLAIDGEKYTFFLGTSPGYRQAHARMAGSDNVYAVQLNVFEFSTAQDDWLDTEQLQIKEEITSIQVTDYEFTLTDGKWAVNDLKGSNSSQNQETPSTTSTQTKQVVAERANDIADALKNLQLISVSERTNIDKPSEKLVIKTKKSEIVLLLLATDEGYKQIQRKGDSIVYGVTQDTYNSLLPVPKK